MADHVHRKPKRTNRLIIRTASADTKIQFSICKTKPDELTKPTVLFYLSGYQGDYMSWLRIVPVNTYGSDIIFNIVPFSASKVFYFGW